MSEPRTQLVRFFDSRGETLPGVDSSGAPPRRTAEPPRAELPLGAWRRRAPAQSNVITLRMPSWASSSSKP